MKKRRLNITLDADAARKLTAYAKRMRIPLGRLLQDAALGVLLEDKAPEIPAEDRPSWAKRLMAAGTPAACRHNNGFRHLTLDLGSYRTGFISASGSTKHRVATRLGLSPSALAGGMGRSSLGLFTTGYYTTKKLLLTAKMRSRRCSPNFTAIYRG